MFPSVTKPFLMFHEDDRSKASGDQPSLHIPLSGIPVIQVVAGPCVSTSTGGGGTEVKCRGGSMWGVVCMFTAVINSSCIKIN